MTRAAKDHAEHFAAQLTFCNGVLTEWRERKEYHFRLHARSAIGEHKRIMRYVCHPRERTN